MIEEISGARFDEGDIVDDARGVRKEIGDPRAPLAVLGKRAARTQQLSAMGTVHEGEAFAGDKGLGDGLAVEGDQARLVVE